MPTTITKTLRSSGGDYSLMSTWEATEQRDLVALDEVARLECYNDWPSGLVDRCTIGGWVTNATDRILIETAAGHGHSGNPAAGFEMVDSVNWGRVIETAQSHVTLRNLRLRKTVVGSCIYALTAGAWTCRFENIIASGGGGTGEAGIFALRQTSVNCLVRNATTGWGSNNWYGYEAFNCVAANCTTGFTILATGANTRDEGVSLRNCVAYNNTTNYTTGPGLFVAGTYNNAASNGASVTPPGTNPLTVNIVAGDFLNAAANNFHLSGSGSQLYRKGATITGVVYDVDGDAYHATTPSIGFDEVVSGGGTTLQLIAASVTATGKPLNVAAATILQLTVVACTLSSHPTNLILGTLITMAAAGFVMATHPLILLAATLLSLIAVAFPIVGRTATISSNPALQMAVASLTFTARVTTLILATVLQPIAAAFRLTRKAFNFGGAVVAYAYAIVRPIVTSIVTAIKRGPR